MINKILFIVVPLTIASISNLPSPKRDAINARPSFSLVGPGLSTSKRSSSRSSSSKQIIIGEDTFSCSRYGPFELNNTQNFNVSFSYKLYSISSQTIIERARLFNVSSGSVLGASTNPSFQYTAGQKRETTINVPIKDAWTNNGLTLKIEILNTSYQVLKTFSSNIYPPKHPIISGLTLKREIYTSRSLSFYGDGKKMQEGPEEYNFTNFGDYINVDYYYRLDLNKNVFLFNNEYALTYSSLYLRFNDDEGLFPYYSHDGDGDIIIPLRIVRDGNRMAFAFTSTFYINKRTLQISNYYHAGFVTTNDFYLPVNGRTKFNNKTLYFEISELGYEGITTSIPVKYDTSKSLVGVCVDGDYCIVGGRR